MMNKEIVTAAEAAEYLGLKSFVPLRKLNIKKKDLLNSSCSRSNQKCHPINP
jgi:hypothetical protein